MSSFCTIARYEYVWNGHSMFIYIYITWNIGISKQKNTCDFLVQVWNFLLPLSLKVLQHKERDTHSFYSGFFIPPHLMRHLPKASASKRKSTLLVRCPVLNSTNWLFQNLPKSSVRFQCVTSFTLASPISHLGHCDISRWHVCSACVRMNTCVNVAPK